MFKPIPHPGVLLFGVVLGFFAYIAYQMTSNTELAPARVPLQALSIVLAATSVYLIVCFARGLRMDLALKNEGVLTFARVTAVKEGHRGKGMPEHWWLINFEFRDANGVEHRGEFVEDYDLAKRIWKAGDNAKIRYHPEEPSIFRWLGEESSS